MGFVRLSNTGTSETWSARTFCPALSLRPRYAFDGRTIYLDNLYEEAGVVVELDGAAYHPAEQRWADSRRDNDRAAHGKLTLRYNWPDITRRQCQTAAQVGAVLVSRGMTVRLRRCGPSCTAL
jgi:hypothetical protein